MARSFNGTSDLMDIGTVNCSSANFTVSIWGNCTLSNAYSTLIDLNVGAGSEMKFYVKSTGKTAFYVGATGIWDPSAGPSVSANTWTNFVFTVTTGGNIASFINAVSDSTGSNAGAGVFNGDCRYGNDGAGAHFWGGSMMDGAMWAVQLTALEISALSKGARPYTIRPSSLLFYHPLDGLQSPEPDLSGNAHNATLTGTAKVLGAPIMLFTPRWPQSPPVGAGPPPPGIAFRSTLSPISTRVGTRQMDFTG